MLAHRRKARGSRLIEGGPRIVYYRPLCPSADSTEPVSSAPGRRKLKPKLRTLYADDKWGASGCTAFIDSMMSMSYACSMSYQPDHLGIGRPGVPPGSDLPYRRMAPAGHVARCWETALAHASRIRGWESAEQIASRALLLLTERISVSAPEATSRRLGRRRR